MQATAASTPGMEPPATQQLSHCLRYTVMHRKGSLAWLLSVILVSLPYLIGARGPLVSEGLDPTIFGSVLDKSTRRNVNSGEELHAFLSDVTVSTLLLNGRWSANVIPGLECAHRSSELEAQVATCSHPRRGDTRGRSVCEGPVTVLPHTVPASQTL